MNGSGSTPSNTPSSSGDGGGGGFQTQGQVDWTLVAASHLQLAINVIGRVSHGGIEPHTLAAGYAVAARLRLGELGSRKVGHAVHHLRAFSSVHNALWLGFGIKHIVRQLAESSQGLSLIALSACLSETYTTSLSAEVFGHMFGLLPPSSELAPSRAQWVKLAQTCEGALSSTSFGLTVGRLSTPFFAAGQSSRRRSSSTKAIADALSGIFQVSTGALLRIHLAGGPDCGWLAALAHWLLNMTVEVRDSTGGVLHLLGGTAQSEPQVIVTYATNDDSSALPESVHLVERCFVVPRGDAILQPLAESLHSTAWSKWDANYGRLPWTSALCDAYGIAAAELLNGSLSKDCGKALGCAARVFAARATSHPALRSLFPFDNTKDDVRGPCSVFINTASYGNGFLLTARNWLPELKQSDVLLESMEDSATKEFEWAYIHYNNAIQAVADACHCGICGGRRKQQQAGKASPFCKVGLIETICLLVLNLSRFVPEGGLLPTRRGLELLYADLVGNCITGYDPLRRLLALEQYRGSMTIALLLYSGFARKDIGSSAAVSNGICAYLDSLCRISDDVDVVSRIHVVPGCIEWNQRHYDEVKEAHPTKNFATPYPAKAVMPLQRLDCLVDSSSSDLKSDLLISESWNLISPNGIDVHYRISTSQGTFYVYPYLITKQILDASFGGGCSGQSCVKKSDFHFEVADGEGVIKFDMLAKDSVVLRILPQSALARWVALSQTSTVTPGTALSRLAARLSGQRTGRSSSEQLLENLLQTNQCLVCCQEELKPRADARKSRSGKSPRLVIIVTKPEALTGQSVRAQHSAPSQIVDELIVARVRRNST